jgi:hypothetical protein
MTHEIEIDEKNSLVIARTSGKASVEGFDRLRKELWNLPAWRQDMKLLLDHRALDSRGLDTAQIRQIAAAGGLFGEMRGAVRIASVVETDLGFGLVRMWDSYAGTRSGVEHQVFRSTDEARTWLLADGSGPA